MLKWRILSSGNLIPSISCGLWPKVAKSYVDVLGADLLEGEATEVLPSLVFNLGDAETCRSSI